MPMDPFFSSTQKDQFHEKHQRSRAWAKAIQFRRFCSSIAKESRETAIHNYWAKNAAVRCAKALSRKGTQYQVVAGRPALTGFKPAKKLWRYRNSQNPEGR